MKNIYLFIILVLILTIPLSCKKKIIREPIEEGLLKEWVHHLKLEGGQLYDSIDYFNFKGIGEYKHDHIIKGVTVYSLLKKNGVIEIVEINASMSMLQSYSKPSITYNYYYQKQNYYENTQIFIEDQATVNRTVTYVHQNYIIEYDFTILSNLEIIDTITFYYPDGKTNLYYPNDHLKGKRIEADPYLTEDKITNFSLLTLRHNNKRNDKRNDK